MRLWTGGGRLTSSRMPSHRSNSEEDFETLAKMLDSEISVSDFKYHLAKSRLPVDNPFIGNFHR